jgi:hypothetical protein
MPTHDTPHPFVLFRMITGYYDYVAREMRRVGSAIGLGICRGYRFTIMGTDTDIEWPTARPFSRGSLRPDGHVPTGCAPGARPGGLAADRER